MVHPPPYSPPSVAFDTQLADILLDEQLQAPADVSLSAASVGSRSPFEGYSRVLTPEGGILIHYTDLNLSWPLKCIRVALCLAVTTLGGWLIVPADDDFLSAPVLGVLAATALIDWLILRFKIRARHSVEVRPDCMIIDGKDVFFAEDIGENHPQLQDAPGEPNQKNICATVGTRFVKLMTANPSDDNDRTPDILAAHLKEAIEQLWTRREVTFPEVY
ncbi:hypothetical protein NLM33_46695 [Bradyrhizobium sp. CCGUVB1N3]|uniref:hypothetical protein n=1 Tax=Bradyrhizobium sp. CCGUVB1N3 TaxID=2949629 RepID=UPI0020B3D155|nr:hypothetical protein [Bradyrhizobium sp. CCGUVB1N3]MCP3477648.1 hypothetical protein [Bradyrhizobium sp. CCGUVB1N3]